MHETPKTVLITGASRGIGRAAALLAGQRGWSVGVNYCGDHAMAEQTVAEVIAAGGNAVALQGDVADEGAVVAMFDAATETLGPLDSVVVNAGVVAPSAPLADMALARIERVMRINVIGAMLCAREAARRLPRPLDQSSASLVLLSSAAARLGSPHEYVDYAASKGAIDTLTTGLSKELAAQNIRVNGVRPGIIATDIHASGGQPDRAGRIGPKVPLARAGTAHEVAEAIIWLCSDAASYSTGTIIDVAGGR